MVVAGDSAGGNLTLALAVALNGRRGEGAAGPVLHSTLPPPLGCVLISPWCDLSREYDGEVTSPFDYLTVSDALVRWYQAQHKPAAASCCDRWIE